MNAAAIIPDVASDFEKLALAGNATLTITSKQTGERFTYRIRRKKDADFYFVSVLTGADNENDYTYLGALPSGRYLAPAKPGRGVGRDAPSSVAFAWAWKWRNHPRFGEFVEVRHEGRCCRCGRKLTVPESIDSGLGPECAEKV